MANITETDTYDAGVYLLETTDPVQGGAAGVSNAPLINLANRTNYLRNRLFGGDGARFHQIGAKDDPLAATVYTVGSAAQNLANKPIAIFAFLRAVTSTGEFKISSSPNSDFSGDDTRVYGIPVSDNNYLSFTMIASHGEWWKIEALSGDLPSTLPMAMYG